MATFFLIVVPYKLDASRSAKNNMNAVLSFFSFSFLHCERQSYVQANIKVTSWEHKPCLFVCASYPRVTWQIHYSSNKTRSAVINLSNNLNFCPPIYSWLQNREYPFVTVVNCRTVIRPPPILNHHPCSYLLQLANRQ